MPWWLRLLLDPAAGELAGAGGSSAGTGAGTGGTGSAPPSPASQVAAADMTGGLPGFNPSSTESTPSQAAPSQGADPNNRAGATAQAAVAAQAGQDWQSIREAAARYGYTQISQYQDDEAALVHLIQQAQRAQQSDTYAQLGRQLAPHLTEFQQFRQQQGSAAQAQQAAQQAATYTPPEFDERWLSLMERDPATGLFYGKQGCPPAIVDAANKRLEWQERFQKNPISMFEAYARDQVGPLVQRQVQAQLAQYQQNQQVDGILSANFGWLYQHDQAGRPVTGINGTYMPTPAGQLYIQNVQQLSQAGVRDPRMQDQLARQLVAGLYAQGQRQQQQPAGQAGQPTAATNMARGSASRPNVNPAQARPPAERAQNGVLEPDSTGLSLAEMIRRDLDAQGVTDNDFALFD